MVRATGGSAISKENRGVIAGIALAVLGLSCPVGAGAQDVEEVSIEDTEHWFQFARGAAENGDVPGAIAALERVLLNNPDLANIRLELGLLYLRVGNAPLAQSYLQDAYEAPNVPQAVRARVQEALGNAELGLERTFVAASAQAGFRYQSNPNGSPGEVSLVLPGGAPVIIGADGLSITRESDFSFFSSADLEVAHGLGGQRSTALVGSLSLGQQTYFEISEIDSIFVAGELGPRFTLGPSAAPNGFIRPYVNVTYLNLGDADFFTAYGGGLLFNLEPQLGLILTSRVNYSYRDYADSTLRPRGSDQTGDYFTLSTSAYFQVVPRTGVQIGALAEFADAAEDYWSRDTLGASVNLDQAIRISETAGATLRLGAAYRRSDYDEIDPLVSLTDVRREDRFDLSLGLDIPLVRTTALNLQLQQTWNEADLPNYDYNNTLVSAGISYRF